MSIEIVLIPLGMVAYKAVTEHFAAKEAARQLGGFEPTRVAGPAVLTRTLEHIGATDVVVGEEMVTATLSGRAVEFRVVDGLVCGRVLDDTGDETTEMLAELDGAAGRLAQGDQVEAMRTRAAQLGLRLVGEEVANDGTVQLVFEEAD